MSARYPQKWNGGSAYWEPQLSLEVRVRSRRRPLATPQPRQPVSGASRLRLWLRAHGLDVMERLVLSAGVAAMVLPRVESRAVLVQLRRSIKRVFDLVGSIVGLLLASPAFIVVPLLIKLDSPGPVFYFQSRVGLDRRHRGRRALSAQAGEERRAGDRRQVNSYGRVFRLIKFRSMVDNAEIKCGPVWATANDPRITRLGRFLRRSRIDEIPQLLNVVAGQMSLVGPRPERPHFVSRFCDSIEDYARRQRVKPGITGLAQIENGYDRDLLDVRRKVEYDLAYIRRWNPLLDLRILLRTVLVVLSGWGAQ